MIFFVMIPAVSDDKIFYSIILSVSIKMVNVFVSQKSPSDMIFHNCPMCFRFFSVNSFVNISVLNPFFTILSKNFLRISVYSKSIIMYITKPFCLMRRSAYFAFFLLYFFTMIRIAVSQKPCMVFFAKAFCSGRIITEGAFHNNKIRYAANR